MSNRRLGWGILLTGIWLLMVILSGCQSDAQKTPEVKHIQVSLNVRRLDRDLYQLDTNNLAGGMEQLQQIYPDFLNFYLDTLMGFNIHGTFSNDNPGVAKNLRTFLTHPDYRGLFDTVQKHFPDTRQVDDDLTNAFRYLKHYQPGFHEPRIVYLISVLNNYAAFTLDSTIVGVGLDMYLGPQYPYYASVGIPAYSTHKLRPGFVVVNVLQALYRLRHPLVMENRSLLDMMIQLGKEQYFLEKVVPFARDTTRLGFTQAQLTWCRENEAQIYNFFVQEKLLYETSLLKVARYVMDGPSATGMPKESPGNVGTWLGYQIVKAYLARHPEKSLMDIIQPEDSQRFLQEAGYRPQ